MTMLNVYDLSRKKRAVLQNAYNIVEEHEINQIYSLHFSFPASDEKVQYVLPRHYVRYGDDHELYRIKKPSNSESNIDVNTYECEHVITTLCDNVMFGSHTVGGSGMHTAAVIRWILSKQSTQNWVLYECDFDRQFEYLWEQENLLNALYSIPKEFATPYMWFFDTTVYPWRISLKAINPNGTPGYYLRAKSNILSSGTSADYSNICTRIYPLGYGEGVNQLTIKDVNNGVPYLQSPKAYTDKYGIVEKVLVDRRFENAESLKAYAQTTLDAYQEPTMSRSFDVTDLYPLTHQSWDDAEVGKICRMTKDNTTAYITKTRRQYDKAGDLKIDISTKPNDIASNIADLADRVRIESVYAQGATQLYQHSKDANATPEKGMIMSLYFPSEMRQINKVLMRLKLNKFRSYSQTTESNGGYSTTLSVSESSKDITSQTNTENQSVTVTSSSVSIATQTNTSDESVPVQSSSVAIETQTNTSNESVTVQTQSDIVTVGMDADADQSLTTTRGGGGSGTTSYQIGNRTIDINSTSGIIWQYDENWVKAMGDSGIEQKTEDGEKNSSWDEIETQSASGPATIAGHIHKIWGLMPHKHKYNPTVYVYKKNLAHEHPINLTGVGEHNHGFTVDDHVHEINIGHTHKVTVPSQTLSIPCPQHTHNVTIPSQTLSIPCPSHTHNVTIPSQTLSIPCPKHKHNITIPGWSKTITIPSHSHGIEAGIYESGNPTAFDIYVGGVKKTTVSSTNFNDDITTWLLNNKNQVPRGSWIDVEIRPNDKAYVVCSVFVQGFVQSRGGGNY